MNKQGNLLVTGGADCSIKLWDLSSGKQITSYSKFEAPVLRVRFARTGSTLAAASGDSSVKLFSTTKS